MRFGYVLSALLLISAPSIAQIKLALNWKPEPQFGGFYAADIQGLYKQQDLNVVIIPGGAGTPTVQVVASGKVDYGIVSADEAIIAKDRGADIVALFATYQTNPQAIMTRADREFKSMQDIFQSDGMLAMQLGLPYAAYLQKKFSPAKVNLVPYMGGISNFLSNKKFSQQCFATSEPLTASKKNIKVQTFLVADEGYNPYTTVLITSRKVYKERKDEVKKFVAATRLGWESYLKDSSPVDQYMQKLNPSSIVLNY